MNSDDLLAPSTLQGQSAAPSLTGTGATADRASLTPGELAFLEHAPQYEVDDDDHDGEPSVAPVMIASPRARRPLAKVLFFAIAGSACSILSTAFLLWAARH